MGFSSDGKESGSDGKEGGKDNCDDSGFFPELNLVLCENNVDEVFEF